MSKDISFQKMTEKIKYSNTIDNNLYWVDVLRAMAALAVVWLHVAARIVADKVWLFNFDWWIANMAEGAVRWCVPIFVMISGSLLLEQKKEERPVTFYKKRIKRIISPIIFWSVFYFSVRCFLGGGLTWGEMLRNVWHGKPYYHMWFLYMILGLYVVTPFLRIYLKRTSGNSALVVVILLFWGSSLLSLSGMKLNIANMWVLYLGYYLLGYYFKEINLRKVSINFIVSIFLLTSLGTSVGFYFLVKWFNGGYSYNYLSPNVILMSISFYFLIRKACLDGFFLKGKAKKIINNISGWSLGLYLVHPFFLKVLIKMGISPSNFPSLWSIPVFFVIVTLCSVLTVVVMKRIPIVKNCV